MTKNKLIIQVKKGKIEFFGLSFKPECGKEITTTSLKKLDMLWKLHQKRCPSCKIKETYK